MNPEIKQIEYKKDIGEKLISLEIDENSQGEMLKNPGEIKSISAVFEAVGKIQNVLEKKLQTEEK